MYADQLEMWAAAVGRDRMHVLVFEEARSDAQATVDRLWGLVGVDPVPLVDVDEASGSSSTADWDWTPGLRESLVALYRPQLARLRDDWGLDVSSWRSFD